MNRFTRLTALLLAMLMIFSTFATAEGYQVGEMSQENWNQIVTDAKTILETPVIVEGEPKEPAPAQPGNTQPYQNTVAVQLGDNAEMSTADLAVVTAAQADQWQIAYTADVWVNIANENGATLNVNASMLQGTAMAVRQVKSDDVTTFTLNEASVSTAQSDAAAFTVESREGTTADEPLTIEEANPDVEANKFGLQINYVTQSNVAVASPYTASFVNGSSYTATVKHPEVKGYTPKLSTTSGTMGVTLAANNEDDKEVSVTYSFTNLTPNGTIKIKVVYEPIDVTYVVNHYQQKANDNEYTLHETETKYGKTESTTEAKAKTYDGFYALLFEQPEIAADGKTTVNIYYDRHYYLMQFVLGDGGYGVEPIYARYDADIGDVGAPTRPGYTFKGWTTDPNATVYTEGQTLVTPETTMPLNGATYYAVWEMGDSAKVNIVFYGQNPNDDGYSYLQTGEVMAKPGTEYTYTHGTQTYLYCELAEHNHATDGCQTKCGKIEHTTHTEDCVGNCTHTKHTLNCYKAGYGSLKKLDNKPDGVTTPSQDGIVVYKRDYRLDRYYLYLDGAWYQCEYGDTFSISMTCSHEHNTSCYNCEYHEHSAACYDCGLEEHTHTTTGAGACTGTVAGLNSTLWTFKSSETASVEADGSTTIKVYYDRVTYNVEFHSNQNCTNEYTNLRITAKWGQSILDKWPTYNGSSSWLVQGKSNTWQNSIQIMPVGGAKFWGPKTGSSSYKAYYYVEALSGDTDTFVHNGVTYKLHHTDISSSSGDVTDEERYAIEGFTYKEGTANGQSYDNAKFYYTRHKYAIEFYSPTTLLKKMENVPYQSPLSSYDWTPDASQAPTQYEPGSVIFEGWYLDPQCAGEKYDFTDKTMPVGTKNGDTTLVLYANWVPVTRTVTFYIDRATMEDPNGEPMKIVTVPHGSKLTEEQIPTAEQAGYTFVGWFYIEDGKVNAFDFANMPVNKDLTVYAQWTSDTMVPYRVEYIYKAGDVTYKVAADTTGSALGGSTKTFEAKVGGELYEIYQTGYFPSLTRSHNIEMVINEVGGVVQEVVYTFEYFKRDAVPYVVYYVTEQQNDENPLAEVTINGKTYYQLLNPHVVDENDKAIVTEAFQVVHGYMPDAAQKSLVLNPEIGDSVAWLNINGVQVHPDNVIVFVYSEDATHAYYVYSYYIQELDGSYTLYAREDEQVGVVNNTYNNKPLTTVPEGFEYARTDVCNAAGEVNKTTTEKTVSAVLTAQGLEFKHYYDRVIMPYVVYYYEQSTTNEVYPDKQGEGKMYGWQVTEEAVDLEPAYRLVSTNEKSITISTTESENVIIFEYAENLVTIAYVPVGLAADKETGALTSSGETIKAITGTPTGSTANEVSGYTFKGWYTDEACTIPVTTNDGTVTNTTFVPEKEAATENLPQGYYSDATFYALYTENTATITYHAVYKDADGNLYLDATGGTVDVPDNGTAAGASDSETLAVVTTDTAKGATAKAAANYKFVGWYSDEVCTTPVADTPDYSPAKPESGLWNDVPYYALFELDVADLTITKTVTGTTETDTFEFTVELTDANDNPLTGEFKITGANETKMDDGTFTLTVAPSDNTSTSVTIEDLPIGTKYTVTETPKAGYTASQSEITGTIDANDETAAFTNTYSVAELTITKEVVPETNVTAPADAFTITVNLTAGANAVLADTYTVKMGNTNLEATYTPAANKKTATLVFDLVDGQTATISGLQVDTAYTVSEADMPYYTEVVNASGATISSEAANIVTVTNMYNTGNLTVAKKVEGTYAPAGEKFSFTLTLKDGNTAVTPPLTVNGTAITWTNNVYTFELGHDERITIYGIPDGVTYTVTEVQPEGFAYTTKVNGVDGYTTSGTANDNPTVTFTNTYKYSQLTITKNVSEDTPAGIADQSFNITVTLPNKTGDYTYTNRNGTSGKVPSDGKLTIKDGEAITIDKVPIGETYSVTEDDLTYFDEKVEPNSGTIVDAGNTVAITNAYKPGSLTITKTVQAAQGVTVPADDEFEFTVTLKDVKGNPISGTFSYYKNNAKDTLSSIALPNAANTLKLKADESVTFTNLPAGVSYTVAEAAHPDYKLTAQTGDTGTITADGTTAAFTNTYQYSDLKISKTVQNDSATLYALPSDPAPSFEFTVSLTLPEGASLENMTAEGADISSSTVTFTLSSGGNITLKNIPVGTKYTVKETEVAGYTTTVAKNGAAATDVTSVEGTIAVDTVDTVAFTNTYSVGKLTVTKTVVDNSKMYDLSDDPFTFIVEFKRNDVAYTDSITYQIGAQDAVTVSPTEGKIQFTLKDTESVVFHRLPAGVTYKVTEGDMPYAGYTVTANPITGQIAANTSSTAAFTNTYNTGSLTIHKTGMTSGEVAVFTVTGSVRGEEIRIKVVVPNGESTTINGLDIGGRYDVSEVESWTWRYTSSGPAAVTIPTDGKYNASVTFENTEKHDYWLDGSDYEDNRFGNTGN